MGIVFEYFSIKYSNYNIRILKYSNSIRILKYSNYNIRILKYSNFIHSIRILVKYSNIKLFELSQPYSIILLTSAFVFLKTPSSFNIGGRKHIFWIFLKTEQGAETR